MNIEQKVASLELSRGLFELGWKLETEFIWIHNTIALRKHYAEGKDTVRAPLACEIGEVLPTQIDRLEFFSTYQYFEILNEKIKGDDIQLKRKRIWRAVYRHKTEGCMKLQEDTTEANARAKMLIHLTKQGLVKPEKQ
jgi:hypothetical protein